MSLANRSTTEEEALRLRYFGFYISPFESDATAGNWMHPVWTPNGHLGPDEALKLCQAHEELTEVRPSTEEEAQTLSARGWLRSPFRSSSDLWFDRRQPDMEPRPVGLALLLSGASK